MTEAFPLQWPIARPRTKVRKDGNFNKKEWAQQGNWRQTKAVTIADAMVRLTDELGRVGGKGIVLSSNLARNRDGSPRSNQSQPVDPGVALYFTLKGKPICMPCDTYTRVEQNIVAIAKHIEATRAIERYGVASLDEMFTGFAALPAPSAARAWWEVLGVSQYATVDQINAAWREKAKQAHSDLGGSDARMSEINVARDTGIKSREMA